LGGAPARRNGFVTGALMIETRIWRDKE
jgi:hypothetical protein